MLRRFDAPINAVVVGANGGIGQAVCDLFKNDPGIKQLFQLARTPREGQIYCDLDHEDTIAEAARIIAEHGDVGLIINATGMLHDPARQIMPEKSFRHLNPETMNAYFQANCIGPALAAKYFLPLMPRRGRAVFAAVSARVGSIADNRAGGWHSYRAAKAGLNMMIRNFAHEMVFKNPDSIVIGLHPGTVETSLSAPFRDMVKHDIFPPDQAARQLLAVIGNVTPAESGHQLDWKGEIIPG
ncbi:SDR family NAD(P)-dependent oxidoreductase [Alphaproteobacteria bacterium LSUCC0684]